MTTIHSSQADELTSRGMAGALGGRFFNNLDIGGKLTVGFGMLGALTLLVVALSYLASGRATTNINHTTDVSAPAALAAARAQANLLSMLADVRGYLALGDETYRSGYERAREAFLEDLTRLEEQALQGDAPASSVTDPEFARKLADIQVSFEQWDALPEQLFSLRDDQLQREPALRILLEESNPLIIGILAEINRLIDSQQLQEPSSESMALLSDMAAFQSSFYAMVAGLRGYVTTGRESFKFEYTSNLNANNEAWEKLNRNQAQLNVNAQARLGKIALNRDAFLPLPQEMFAIVEGEHAREDLFLFRDQAVPLAEAMLRDLSTLTADQQTVLQTDLSEGRAQLVAAQRQTLAGGIVALILGMILALVIRENISGPIRRLTAVAEQVHRGDLTAQATVNSRDEVGTLAQTFNEMTGQLRATLEDLEGRRAELETANLEISILNNKLTQENLRLSAELEVTRQLQQMILPNSEELEAVVGLDIAGYMEPADEVGGDYYDVLIENGAVKIGIGDVTDHGLESGVIMLMTQTAVRTLLNSGETDPVRFLDILNRTVYGNVQRMNTDRNLTLSLLDYANSETGGEVRLSGQHEEMIVVRKDGSVELVDTTYLGFPIGLDDNIADFIDHTTVQLAPGDGVVLFTDGITEAENLAGEQYGMERLCAAIRQHWAQPVEEIKNTIIDDVRRFIGAQTVFDDITLVVLKQR